MQLEEWLVPKMPTFLKYPESADADVVSAVELGLAEMAAGIRTEENFREFLKQVLQEQTAVLTFFPSSLSQRGQLTESFSSNQTFDNPASIIFNPSKPISVAA